MSGRASGGGLVRHTQEDEGPLEGREGLEIPSVRAAAMAEAVCPLIPVCPTPCIPSPVTSSSSKHEAQEREYFYLNDVHSFFTQGCDTVSKFRLVVWDRCRGASIQLFVSFNFYI